MSIRTLFLCEKPDQAMKVARELGPVARKDGWVECKDGVVVTWARGHLYQPMMPEDYSEELKRWTWDTLPIIPKPFKFKARDDSSKKMVRIINGLLDRTQEVVIATDPDREGELIAYEILVEKGYRGRILRAVLKDLTQAAIRKALANLEPGEKWHPEYQAALARTCADWVVGMNMSRAATLKLRQPGSGKPMSVGRVQTPTLALMVRLERRIREFKPQDYYELVADVATKGGHRLKMRFRQPEDRRITDAAKIAELKKRAEGAQGPLAVTTEEKEKAPPPLLDLNALQQEANSRFGWSSDKTLQIAQALYEGNNGAGQPLTTYPRTDCQVLPEEHIGQIAEKVQNLMALPSFAHLAPKLAKPIIRPAHYDDSRVTAHTAIVPTLEKAKIHQLSADERKIYELVCRFYLAAHLPDYRYRATRVVLDANGVPFAVGGTVPTFAGWREAFNAFEASEDEGADGGEDDAGVLPPVKNGEPARADKVEIEAKKTKAPERFTEKKLLQAMKNIAAFVDDAAAKKRLKQTSGIGTSATRAAIIKTLKDREFIRVEKRKLVPTESGMGLIAALELAAPGYADPAVTARWEDGLESISQRQLSVADFVAAVVEKIKRDVVSLRDRTDLGTFATGGEERKVPFISREAREEIEKSGFEIHVPYGKNDEAKEAGFVWIKERSCWMAPAGADKQALISKGWLNPDGSRPAPQKVQSGGRRDEILKTGIPVKVPYGKNDEAKAFGGVFDGNRKLWVLPAGTDHAKLVEMGWINEDGSLPEGKPGGSSSGGGRSEIGGSRGGPSGSAGASRPQGKGTKLVAEFDRRNDVKALGARWEASEKAWYAPPGADLAPFIEAGFPPAEAA